MKVGAYALANGGLPGDGLARNVVVTHSTQGGTADTLGTVTIHGTDVNNDVMLEEITPVADTPVVGTKAFKTVTSIVGAGWAIDAGGAPAADHIKVGFGTLVGLPVFIGTEDKVIAVALGTAFINAPTVAHGTLVSDCMVDASSGVYDGTKKLRVMLLQ
jgi:hypothetical protein